MLAHIGDLVDLLLIFDDGKARAAMVQNIGNFFGHAVLIDRHRHCTDALRGDHGPIEVRPVAPDNGDLVARRDPLRQQTKRQRFDFLGGLGPGPALPDAELFLTIGGLVRKVPGVPRQKAGNRSQIRCRCG